MTEPIDKDAGPVTVKYGQQQLPDACETSVSTHALTLPAPLAHLTEAENGLIFRTLLQGFLLSAASEHQLLRNALRRRPATGKVLHGQTVFSPAADEHLWLVVSPQRTITRDHSGMHSTINLHKPPSEGDSPREGSRSNRFMKILHLGNQRCECMPVHRSTMTWRSSFFRNKLELTSASRLLSRRLKQSMAKPRQRPCHPE